MMQRHVTDLTPNDVPSLPGNMQGESYGLLQNAFGKCINEINKLKKSGKIVIKNKEYDTEFVLGGDMKFILIERGLQSVCGRYNCFLCKAASKPESELFTLNKFERRTLSGAEKDLKNHAFGQIHPPLFKFEHCDIKCDELHLRLRICDKLLKVMLDHAIYIDRSNNKATASNPLTGPTLHALVKAINYDCGIHFNVWKTRDDSKEWEFTSLMGPAKLVLMASISAVLYKVFKKEFSDKYSYIWTKFYNIYQQIREKVEFAGVKAFRTEVAEFLNAFLELEAPGTSTSSVTPYMHMLWEHIAEEMEEGGIHQYSGQGVEGLNNVHRDTCRHKSNNWCPEQDCILVEWRLHYLERCGRVRIPNKYDIKDKNQHSKSHKRKRDENNDDENVISDKHVKVKGTIVKRVKVATTVVKRGRPKKTKTKKK
eukprot:Lithocolla_globosa_v1_NODE_3111_length_1764_cov_52.787010.p1 type:complete len:425 gc:universal NODE_3111_length_1764_cov_52.787010:1544-270(-)